MYGTIFSDTLKFLGMCIYVQYHFPRQVDNNYPDGATL